MPKNIYIMDMNEADKMRSSQLANTASPEIQERFKRAKKLLLRLNATSGYDEECRSVLEELIPGIPASATIWPPFCCDHGDGIRLGEHVFINSNCTFPGRWLHHYRSVYAGRSLCADLHPSASA